MTDGPGGFVDRPGVMSDPVLVYSEDFENLAEVDGLFTPLLDYVSATGVTYTADPFWADPYVACNGFAASALSDLSGTCADNASSQGGLLALANVLGQINGSNPNENAVLSAYTSGPAAAPGLVQFATVGEVISMPTAKRFVTFSVNAAATSCWAAQPSLSFSRVSNGVETPIDLGVPINPCTDPRAVNYATTDDPDGFHYYAGTFASSGSFLSDGEDFGIVMRNGSGATAGNDAAVDDIRVLDVTPHLNKEFAPERVLVGDVSTLTFTVTNTSELAEKNGWAFTDTLRDGLTFASEPNIAQTCDAEVSAGADGVLTVENGVLASGQMTCEISVDVTSAAPRGAQPSPVVYVNNVNDISDVIGLDATNETTVEFFSEPLLSIDKTSDASQDVRVGQTIIYEVQVTNPGTADFTAANPASFTDDLSDVLDDAEWNDDAAVSFSDGSTGNAPTRSGDTLNWSGALKAGETATFTYSVTLSNAGNGAVINNACVPDEFAAEDETCAATTSLLPKLVIAKSSDVSALPANGSAVLYEITVTNVGPGDATAQNPASFTDDLADVLDDADFVDGSLVASSGNVARDGNELTWSGALAASESVRVAYQVLYDSTHGGDHRLVNVACLPVAMAADAGSVCAEVEIPGAALRQWKTADPTSSVVAAGDEITYTLHFKNEGRAAVDIDNSDDLSDVIDDADLIAAPISSSSALTSFVDGNTIRVAGSLAAGEEETIQYTVKVRQLADRGDSVLTNALATCEANDTALCEPVVHTVAHLTIEKSADVVVAGFGDAVTYTIRVTNAGTGAYTDEQPATFVDNLEGVLDDASYNDDAGASSGSVTFSAPTLTWRGALAPGESAEVTYSVRVTSAGDRQLLNTVCVPNVGEDAACDDNIVLLPHLMVVKSVDPASGSSVVAGQTVTYTLSFENDGLASAAIDYTDDLSDVLDDAKLIADATASDSSVEVVTSGEQIEVVGVLAAGQSVNVTYAVVVNADGERGNNLLGNLLADSGVTDPMCEQVGVYCTQNPIGELETWKTVNPGSGATLRAGDSATYTLHFENTGNADVAVNHDDILTQVLDDAVITQEPSASSAALRLSAINDGRFTITGTVGAGESETVTYTVTVKATGDRGDDRLANFLVPQGAQPSASCEIGEDERTNCTVNHVSDVRVVKSSDPVSGTEVSPGDEVVYTVTFTNHSNDPGSAPAVIDYIDHMQDVLDDAALAATPVSSSASVVAEVEGETIRLAGEVASGEVVTVSYSVQVKAYDEQGDHSLKNVVAVTGEGPVCTEGSGLCTVHDVPPVGTVVVPPAQPDDETPEPSEPPAPIAPPGLAVTGSDIAVISVIAALSGLMVVIGVALFVRRRDPRVESASPLV